LYFIQGRTECLHFICMLILGKTESLHLSTCSKLLSETWILRSQNLRFPWFCARFYHGKHGFISSPHLMALSDQSLSIHLLSILTIYLYSIALMMKAVCSSETLATQPTEHSKAGSALGLVFQWLNWCVLLLCYTTLVLEHRYGRFDWTLGTLGLKKILIFYSDIPVHPVKVLPVTWSSSGNPIWPSYWHVEPRMHPGGNAHWGTFVQRGEWGRPWWMLNKSVILVGEYVLYW
jgi:hypothetical protein